MTYVLLYAVRMGVMTHMFVNVYPHKSCEPFKMVTIFMDLIFTFLV